QLPIHRNLRPTTAIHDPVVQRSALGGALLLHLLQLDRRNSRSVSILKRGQPAGLWIWTRGWRYTPAGQSGDGHADHSREDALLESVASVGRDLRLLIHPALPPPPHVSCFQVFASERALLLCQFDDRFRQLHTRGPGFIHSRSREHIRASRPLADAGIAVACEIGLAVAARFLQRLRSPRL